MRARYYTVTILNNGEMFFRNRFFRDTLVPVSLTTPKNVPEFKLPNPIIIPCWLFFSHRVRDGHGQGGLNLVCRTTSWIALGLSKEAARLLFVAEAIGGSHFQNVTGHFWYCYLPLAECYVPLLCQRHKVAPAQQCCPHVVIVGGSNNYDRAYCFHFDMCH